jgi:Tfp pilus assembly protein PilO
MKEKKIHTAEYIKIIKESPEKKNSYMFFGVTIIVVIILIVFAIRPTITTIRRINQEIKEKTRTNELLEKKINTLSELDKEYIDYKEEFDDLRLLFPAGDNFSLFLANIEAVTARNGFVLSSVRFDKYRGQEHSFGTRVLIPSAVSINVKGKEANLIGFLRNLEQLPMYPTIESLSYGTQRDADGLSSFNINLRIYSIENDKFYD